MVERRGVYRVLVGKPEGNDHVEGPGIDEVAWTGSIWLRIGVRHL